MYLLIQAKLLVLKFKFKIMLSVTWMYLHRNQILLSFHAGSTEPAYCLEISFDICLSSDEITFRTSTVVDISCLCIVGIGIVDLCKVKRRKSVNVNIL